jgi:hypothetical protein
MAMPKLTIVKKMVLVHGKMRAFIEVKGHVAPTDAAFLLEHFSSEGLFKRTAYASGFSDGGLPASPPLVRMLNHFVKNDACPEVTVKTLLSGQKYEGNGLWDIQCFEFIAKRSFDALVELAEGVRSFDAPTVYHGFGVEQDLAAFSADSAADLATALAASLSHAATSPAAVAVGDVKRMADAA